MTRAAVYLRVSTRGQADEDRFGLDVQAAQVREYAQRHGLTLTDTYTDQITGTRHRREQLDALLDRADAYDAVIISSVDRLGRRNRITYAVLDELLDTGVALHSADMGPIDPDDENSMLQFGVRSLFAENDHRRLVLKLHRAQVAKVAGNPLTGKPGQPIRKLNGYGWRAGQIDPVESEHVRWMFQRAQDVGSHVIARELDERGVRTRSGRIWVPENVRRILHNPLYKGVYEFGRLSFGQGTVKARCEVTPLVTVELWDAVQRKLDTRSGQQHARPDRRNIYPLTGHIRCGECGRAMGGLSLSSGHGKARYACTWTVTPKIARSGKTCEHRRAYPAPDLHAAVETALHIHLTDAELAGMITTPAPRVPDHTAALAELARRGERLEAAYMAGAYTPEEYAQRRGDLARQREGILTAPVPLPLPSPTIAALRARLIATQGQPLHDLVQAVGLTVRVYPDERSLTLELDPPEL